MGNIFRSACILAAGLACATCHAQDTVSDDGQPPAGGTPPPTAMGAMAQMGGMGGGGSGLGGYTEVTEAGRVPEHLFNIVLGRPTQTEMTANVVAHKAVDAYIAYGSNADVLSKKTDVAQLGGADKPVDFIMDQLHPDTRYHYRLHYKLDGKADYEASDLFTFHMPRAFDSEFVFTVQADSHLDENTSGEVYTNALNGALESGTDFHLALGDTFMTAKYVEYPMSKPHYLAQRYYFGLLNHSAPLFFALGNHDAESGNEARKNWSTSTRNDYFPNPSPNDFYSGNTGNTPEGEPVRNYYAFEWGNSLFIALDPFRYNEGRGGRGPDNWYMTLGKTQYDWLVSTVAESEATFKFVYLHNLVGGAESNRGGAEASANFEWGGHEYDGTYTFDEKRPGWGKPIHDVLVENGVSIVFHGHDHMYIRQERDGLIYQLVPQPGHPGGNVNSAEGYGYLSGDIIAGSGHLRVSLSADEARVDFIDSRINTVGNLLHSYTVLPR